MRQLNLQLVEAAAARPDVTILDIDEIASLIGKREWDDARMWIGCKAVSRQQRSVGLLAVPESRTPARILGLSSKCLVLDLDTPMGRRDRGGRPGWNTASAAARRRSICCFQRT